MSERPCKRLTRVKNLLWVGASPEMRTQYLLATAPTGLVLSTDQRCSFYIHHSPSQESTYHNICNTSCGSLVGMRNRLTSPPNITELISLEYSNHWATPVLTMIIRRYGQHVLFFSLFEEFICTGMMPLIQMTDSKMTPVGNAYTCIFFTCFSICYSITRIPLDQKKKRKKKRATKMIFATCD